MIPAQRRAVVLDHIRKRGAASVQELSDVIGISISTVRRDLEYLEDRGYLERAHGGAVIQQPLRSTFEPEAAISAQFLKSQKQAIGSAAAAMLRPGDSVIFDSSSTVLAAAHRAVQLGHRLTAVTNDLGIGQVLAAGESIRTIVLGGTLRSGSLTLLGEPAQEFLAGLSADVALLGTHAISGDALTETSLEVAVMKRAMIAAARRVILLADSSKFQAAAFCRICDIRDLKEIITDEGADAEEIARLRRLGLTVTVVPSLGGPEGASG